MEVVIGLEDLARQEIEALPGHVDIADTAASGSIHFTYGGSLSDLLRLRLAVAAYLVRAYPIARPLALLGHQNFHQLLADIRDVLALHPPAAFRSLRISAAGETSSVYERLRRELGTAAGLSPVLGEGDLSLHIRRSADRSDGFEVAIRVSPRPLSARPWRVCDMPGALNASVARAVVRLMQPSSGDCFVNLACGSGTLLVERLENGPVARAIGVDSSAEALRCASRNLAAAGLEGRAELVQGDAGAVTLPDASVSAVCADLPWGQLVGTHEVNEGLYPRVIREAARVAVPGAPMVLLSAQVRLMERTLREHSSQWKLERELRLRTGTVNVRAYVLSRRG
ncbi:MAG: methyltransferase domain-containing protein [Chloroflexota bacterium]|nr:methyltransferase domain-containing protein [Chloroflexota bacterium]